MKPAFVLFLILFSVTAFAQRERGLTRVVREACISFPKVTSPENMVEGVHFTRDSYCMYEDYQGHCESRNSYVVFKYFYWTKKTVEFWSADGRLVTSTKENDKSELYSITGEHTGEAEKKIVPEIQKKIFNSSEPVCEDSFYK